MSSRVIDTSFWTDSKVEGFTATEKLIWIYLLTNPKTNLLGVYSFTARRAAFEMALDEPTVRETLNRFETEYGMIRMDGDEIAVKNFLAYGVRNGGKPLMDGLRRNLEAVKSKALVVWVYQNAKGRNDINASALGVIKEFVEEHCSGIDINNTPIDNNNTLIDNPLDKQLDNINNNINNNIKQPKLNININKYVSQGDTESETQSVTQPTRKASRNQGQKEAVRKYGEYGWVKLTDKQYDKLIADLGKDELDRCIRYIDELAQSSTNKNKWSDWNLVLRRCNREGWGLRANGSSKKSGSAYIDAINNRFDAIDEWAAAYGGKNG